MILLLVATVIFLLTDAAAPPLPSTFYDHVGLVVNDTKSTAFLWTYLLGKPPPSFFNNAGPAGNVTYLGAHTDANILGSYMDCNGIGLEILQPTDTYPSLWRDSEKLNGNSPLYLGFASDDWNENDLLNLRANFTTVGAPTLQTGYWWQNETAGNRGCYAYMDCVKTPFGVNVEVMSRNNCKLSENSESKRWQQHQQQKKLENKANDISSSESVLSCKNIAHVAVVVPNATASVEFWSSSFGLTEIPHLHQTKSPTMFRNNNTNAKALWADIPMLQDGKFSLRIYQPMNMKDKSWWLEGLENHGPSVNFISFVVDDIEATMKILGKQYDLSILQRGNNYIYVDSMDALGIVIELRDEKN